MSIPGAASPLFLGAAVAEAAFQIDRSLRFNSADSAYLNRTPSSAGNRRTFTFSTWIKRHKLDTDQKIFGVNSNWFTFYFTSDNLRIYYENSGSQYFTTDAVFRDVSAWYHLVLKVDTTQSSASDRVKIYANGQELSFSSTGTTSQNYEFGVNTTNVHDIGMRSSESNMKADFSLADIHFIDGQALAPTDFGEYDSNNVWQPKDASGLTFGTNGFHLDFSDTSDLGADAAGSNDWTPNNLVGSAPGLSTANQGFDAVTYSGNGSTQSISGLNFQPDFVWLKETGPRTNVSHQLYDVVRGTSKMLQSDNTGVEATISGVTGFTSNGFNLGSNGGGNNSGSNYVAWCWKAGGSASLNEDGSIDSQVSVSTDYGFSAAIYTGNGSAGATVGHGLGSVPKFILVKNRSGADIMVAYHESVGNTGALRLTTAATDTGFNWWNSTTPSSSVFTIGNTGATNNSSDNYVAYCWSEVSGFSKFGSYSGNGQTLGPKVTTSFEPRLVAIKRTDSAGNWEVYDSARSLDKDLKWNTAEAEGTAPIIFHSDGFQTNFATGSLNASGGSYVYMAFASNPDGSAIDSLIDTPTNYEALSANNGGNYATLNPLDSNIGSNLTNGNLDAAGSSNWSAGHARGTFGLTSGKWYWEVTRTGGSGATAQIGFCNKAFSLTTSYGSLPADSWTFAFGNGTEILRPSGGGTGYFSGSAMGVGDIAGIALDMDNKTAVFYKNGTAGATIDLSATSTGSTDNIDELFPLVGVYNANVALNGGQRPFAYTPPTGYKSLCTTNLTDPTIADGSTAFDAKLYTGNASTQAVTGLNFSPDLVWLKRRDAAGNHNIQDVVRGASAVLQSDYNGAEFTSGPRISSFDTNGFTLTSDNGGNASGGTYVGWAWDAGTSTATNTDGSITSNVRASQANGFSCVGYTGTGANASVGHGLNAAPEFLIIKNRTDSENWFVWHGDFPIPTRNGFYLDLTANVQNFGVTSFNDTVPSNSVITLGTNNILNGSGDNYIAYCFAPVAGYSAFGSYTGNGSSDGPFVFTGHRSRFLLIKASSIAGEDWVILDTERETYNTINSIFFANSSSQEITNSAYNTDILSNGFKLRGTNPRFNQSGATYIFASFASHPFKTARAR